MRWVRALTGTAAYLSAALVPAGIALDVVTTAPLDEETRDSLRLPAPWSFITHEAVPLRAAQADDDELAALIEAGVCVGPEPVILGGLLAAQPDGRLDTTSGFLLISSFDATGKRCKVLQPAAYGDHGGGRVLYGYAAQLAFARWTSPPVLPDPGPRPMSRSAPGQDRDERGWAGRRLPRSPCPGLHPSARGTTPGAPGANRLPGAACRRHVAAGALEARSTDRDP